MPDEILTFDPVSEAAANVAFELNDVATGRLVLEHSYPTPGLTNTWAGSVDTEGDRLASSRPNNREITISFEVTGAALDATLGSLDQKIGKLRREGGTLKRVTPAGLTFVFDVITVDDYDIEFDMRYYIGRAAKATLKLTCKPYWRQAPVTRALNTELSAAALVWTETAIPGSVGTTGYLQVNELQGARQRRLLWGVQSRHYDAAATAALLYEAETRTPMGGAALSAAGANYSGAGSNTIRTSSLTTVFQAFASTKSSGGVNLTHQGTYQVFARVSRVASGAGASVTTFGFEWALGSEFRNPTRNAQTWTVPSGFVNGQTEVVDFGLVTIPAGTPEWEGRFIVVDSVGQPTAAGTSAPDALLDFFFLVPADEAAGQVLAADAINAYSDLRALDRFDQRNLAALTGQTAGVGGTWTGVGSATDFTVVAGGTGGGRIARRTAVSDASTTPTAGRVAFPGGGVALTDMAVEVDVATSAALGDNVAFVGLAARIVDANNFITCGLESTRGEIQVRGVVAGTTFAPLSSTAVVPAVATTGYVTLRLEVYADGVVLVYAALQGSAPVLVIKAQDNRLATGGALASGRGGIYDLNNTATAANRDFDRFSVYALAPRDAALSASKSARIDANGVTRQQNTGSAYQPVQRYEGDYLTVPPAALEGRTARFIVKGTRYLENETFQEAGSLEHTFPADDISAQLTVIPRGLVVPKT